MSNVVNDNNNIMPRTSYSEEPNIESIFNANEDDYMGILTDFRMPIVELIDVVHTHMVAPDGALKFFVKLQNKSYRDSQWIDEPKGNEHNKRKVDEYLRLYQNSPRQKPYYDPDYNIPFKIIERSPDNKYRVMWKNLGINDATWETPESLKDEKLINDFLQSTTQSQIIPQISPIGQPSQQVQQYKPGFWPNSDSTFILMARNVQDYGCCIYITTKGENRVAFIELLRELSKNPLNNGKCLIIATIDTISIWEESFSRSSIAYTRLYGKDYDTSNLSKSFTPNITYQIHLTSYEVLAEIPNTIWNFIIIDDSSDSIRPNIKSICTDSILQAQGKVIVTSDQIDGYRRSSYANLFNIQVPFDKVTVKSNAAFRCISDPYTEFLIECPIDPIQISYYLEIFLQNKEKIKNLKKSNENSVNNVLMSKLHNVCNHPAIEFTTDTVIDRYIKDNKLDARTDDVKIAALLNTSTKLSTANKIIEFIEKLNTFPIAFIVNHPYLQTILLEFFRLKNIKAVAGDKDYTEDLRNPPHVIILLKVAIGKRKNIISANNFILFDCQPSDDIKLINDIRIPKNNAEVIIYRLITKNSIESLTYGTNPRSQNNLFKTCAVIAIDALNKEQPTQESIEEILVQAEKHRGSLTSTTPMPLFTINKASPNFDDSALSSDNFWNAMLKKIESIVNKTNDQVDMSMLTQPSSSQQQQAQKRKKKKDNQLEDMMKQQQQQQQQFQTQNYFMRGNYPQMQMQNLYWNPQYNRMVQGGFPQNTTFNQYSQYAPTPQLQNQAYMNQMQMYLQKKEDVPVQQNTEPPKQIQEYSIFSTLNHDDENSKTPASFFVPPPSLPVKEQEKEQPSLFPPGTGELINSQSTILSQNYNFIQQMEKPVEKVPVILPKVDENKIEEESSDNDVPTYIGSPTIYEEPKKPEEPKKIEEPKTKANKKREKPNKTKPVKQPKTEEKQKTPEISDNEQKMSKRSSDNDLNKTSKKKANSPCISWNQSLYHDFVNTILKFGFSRTDKFASILREINGIDLTGACRTTVKWMQMSCGYDLAKSPIIADFLNGKSPYEEVFESEFKQKFFSIASKSAKSRLKKINFIELNARIVTTANSVDEIACPTLSAKFGESWTAEKDKLLMKLIYEKGLGEVTSEDIGLDDVINPTERFTALITHIDKYANKLEEVNNTTVAEALSRKGKKMPDRINSSSLNDDMTVEEHKELIKLIDMNGYNNPDAVISKFISTRHTQQVYKKYIEKLIEISCKIVEGNDVDQSCLVDKLTEPIARRIHRTVTLMHDLKEALDKNEITNKTHKELMEIVLEKGFDEAIKTQPVIDYMNGYPKIRPLQKEMRTLLHISKVSAKIPATTEVKSEPVSANTEEVNYGEPEFPIIINPSLKVISLGEVVYDRENYHTPRYIYCPGFVSERLYASIDNPREKAWYRSLILDGGEIPIFRVELKDKPEKYYWEGPKPTSPWSAAIKDIERKRSSLGFRSHSVSVSGPESFGLAAPKIMYFISKLPNADKCKRYAAPGTTGHQSEIEDQTNPPEKHITADKHPSSEKHIEPKHTEAKPRPRQKKEIQPVEQDLPILIGSQEETEKKPMKKYIDPRKIDDVKRFIVDSSEDDAAPEPESESPLSDSFSDYSDEPVITNSRSPKLVFNFRKLLAMKQESEIHIVFPRNQNYAEILRGF